MDTGARVVPGGLFFARFEFLPDRILRLAGRTIRKSMKLSHCAVPLSQGLGHFLGQYFSCKSLILLRPWVYGVGHRDKL